MSDELTRDWDFLENTRKYFDILRIERAGGVESKAAAPKDSIFRKIRNYGIFSIFMAFFIWLPMEIFGVVLSPFMLVLNAILRRKVSPETRDYIEKVISKKLNHFEPLIAGAVVDAYLYHGMRGYIRNRPSVIVGAAPTPKMKFRGASYFSVPLIYDEPFDAGTDILLSELAPLRGHPAFRNLMVNSFQRIPMRDGSAGCIVAPHIIDHVPSRREAVMEASRVLRPGGYFIFTDVSEYFFSLQPVVRAARALRVDKIFSKYLKKITTLYLGEGESLEWYKKLLDEAGFDLESAGYWISPKIHYYTQLIATFYRLNKSVLIWHSLAMSVPPAGSFLRWVWRTVQSALIYGDMIKDTEIGVELYFVAKKRGDAAKAEIDAETNLFKTLVCPDTYESLSFSEDGTELVSASGVKYPVVKGIPVLIPELARMYYDVVDKSPK